MIDKVKNFKQFVNENINHFDEDDVEIDLEITEDDEENDDVDGIICPEDCIYYCPNCGNCTARE